MKKTTLLILLPALAAFLAMAAVAQAQGQRAGLGNAAGNADIALPEPSSLPPEPPALPDAVREMEQEQGQTGLTEDPSAPARAMEKAKKVNDAAKGQSNARGDERRSRVASAVEALLASADRSGGIGARVREIAGAQIGLADSAEAKLEEAKRVSGAKRFFWGADYRTLKAAKTDLKAQADSLKELAKLAAESTDPAQKTELLAQAKALAAVHNSLLNEITAEADGFALFGWLARMLAGYN